MTISKSFVCLMLVVLLMPLRRAEAGPLEDGVSAYRNGDCSTAERLWRPLADQGVAEAQKDIGLTYAVGCGAAGDVGQAITWLERAAEQGNVIAAGRLGQILIGDYLNGEWKGQYTNPEKAMSWLHKAAEKGDAASMYLLGIEYQWGKYVQKDDKVGFEWMLQAGEKGYPKAYMRISSAYSGGKGVSLDRERGKEWGNKAIRDDFAFFFRKRPYFGDGDIFFYRSILPPSDRSSTEGDVADALLVKAKKGDAQSQNDLGEFYYDKKNSSYKPDVALEWMNKSAEQNFADAEANLAEIYGSGDVVPANYGLALTYLRRAADHGSACSQYNLASIYIAGVLGVPKDEAQGVSWLKKAAEAGCGAAQDTLGQRYEFGMGMGKDQEAANRWYKKAADHGDFWAGFQLNNLNKRAAR